MTNIRYGREGGRRERGRNRFAHRNFPADKNSLKQVILFMLFKRRNRLKTKDKRLKDATTPTSKLL